MKYQMMGGQCSMRNRQTGGRRTKRTSCSRNRNVQSAGAYGRSASAGFAPFNSQQNGSGRRTKRTGCAYRRQNGSGRRTKRTGCPYRRQNGSGRRTKRAISLNNQRKLRKTKRTSCHGRGNNQHIHRGGYAITVEEVRENK